MVRSALTGTRIRERRTTLRIRQADLARAAGISAAYLNLIEHNRRRVGDALLATLAQALETDPVALAEGAEGALFDGLRMAAAEGFGPGLAAGQGDHIGPPQKALADAERGAEADAARRAPDPARAGRIRLQPPAADHLPAGAAPSELSRPELPRPQTERPELDRIEEFVGRFPGWAGLLAAKQARLSALERLVETYAERLAQDPFLLDALHEVLSVVTALRSSAAILTETEDLEPEWRARFLAAISEESQRLSGTAEALVHHLEGIASAETGMTAPLDQLEAWLAQRDWHLPEPGLTRDGADAGAAQARAVAPGAGPGAGQGAGQGGGQGGGGEDPVSELIATAPELTSAAARALAQRYAARAARDARLLPLGPFLAALSQIGPEPARLAARFDVPLGAVFRRLATLPPEAAAELPGGRITAGLVMCDGAGVLSLRRPVPGFTPPRFGAACPLWPLYEALARPMQPLRAVLEIAGRMPRRFLAYAVAAPQRTDSFDGPVLMESMMLVLPAPATEEAARPVGTACRNCPRPACPGRHEPALLAGSDAFS